MLGPHFHRLDAAGAKNAAPRWSEFRHLLVMQMGGKCEM